MGVVYGEWNLRWVKCEVDVTRDGGNVRGME